VPVPGAASASLVVAEVPGVFSPATAAAPAAANGLPWLLLLAAGVVGVVVVLGAAGMLFVLRRKR
jgi:hypothetical protein